MCLLCIINKLPQTIYCERGISHAFLAEPINAFTNLAYLVAGFLGYQLLKKKKIKDKQLLVLPWMLSIVGLGSFIYHTERNSVTLLFDALPIYIFILYALFLILKQLFQSKFKSFVVLLIFVTVEIALSIYIPKEFLNGSVFHITSIIFISLISIFAIRKYGKVVLKPLISIICLYAAAIVFRSVDIAICPFIPIGTHFLWHILVAFTGYQAIIFLSILKSQNRKQSCEVSL